MSIFDQCYAALCGAIDHAQIEEHHPEVLQSAAEYGLTPARHSGKFGKAQLSEFRNMLKSNPVREPVVGMRSRKLADGQLYLAVGFKRAAMAEKAGLASIPVKVIDLDRLMSSAPFASLPEAKRLDHLKACLELFSVASNFHSTPLKEQDFVHLFQTLIKVCGRGEETFCWVMHNVLGMISSDRRYRDLKRLWDRLNCLICSSLFELGLAKLSWLKDDKNGAIIGQTRKGVKILERLKICATELKSQLGDDEQDGPACEIPGFKMNFDLILREVDTDRSVTSGDRKQRPSDKGMPARFTDTAITGAIALNTADTTRNGTALAFDTWVKTSHILNALENQLSLRLPKTKGGASGDGIAMVNKFEYDDRYLAYVRKMNAELFCNIHAVDRLLKTKGIDLMPTAERKGKNAIEVRSVLVEALCRQNSKISVVPMTEAEAPPDDDDITDDGMAKMAAALTSRFDADDG